MFFHAIRKKISYSIIKSANHTNSNQNKLRYRFMIKTTTVQAISVRFVYILWAQFVYVSYVCVCVPLPMTCFTLKIIGLSVKANHPNFRKLAGASNHLTASVHWLSVRPRGRIRKCRRVIDDHLSPGKQKRFDRSPVKSFGKKDVSRNRR